MNCPRDRLFSALAEHMQRLIDSAKIYRMPRSIAREQLVAAAVELVAHNGVTPCYIRPIVLRGYGDAGVSPFNNPMELYIANWAWGKYLGHEATEQGVDVCVSSWTRLAPNTLPAMAKAGANYMNSQLIKMEAISNGYVEGIALDVNGYVSEGSGENIFVIRGETIYTPPLGNSVLPGITRDSVIRLAKDLGLNLVEQMIPREMLYIADEVFFTGTAAEITPIRSVDKIQVGAGKIGPHHAQAAHRVLRHPRRAGEGPLRLADAGPRAQAAARRRVRRRVSPDRSESAAALLAIGFWPLASGEPLGASQLLSIRERSFACGWPVCALAKSRQLLPPPRYINAKSLRQADSQQPKAIAKSAFVSLGYWPFVA